MSPSSSAPTMQELGLPLIFRRNSHSLMMLGCRALDTDAGDPKRGEHQDETGISMDFADFTTFYPTGKVSKDGDSILLRRILPTKRTTVSFQDKFTIK